MPLARKTSFSAHVLEISTVSSRFQWDFGKISVGFQWDFGKISGFQWDFGKISVGFRGFHGDFRGQCTRFRVVADPSVSKPCYSRTVGLVSFKLSGMALGYLLDNNYKLKRGYSLTLSV